jgi:hypothetical protein
MRPVRVSIYVINSFAGPYFILYVHIFDNPVNMKKIKLLLALPVIVSMIFVSTTTFTGCSKDAATIHDTTVKVVTDTLTLTIHDTVNTCDCNLTDGLVAYYNFNGGSLKDSSGYGNNIFANSATKTTDRFGNANNAYIFDGVSSAMQIHHSASLNMDSITMFAIIKPNGFYSGPCAGNYIISKGAIGSTNGFWSLGYQDIDANCTTPDFNRESFGGSFGDNNPVGSANTAGSDTSFIKLGQWYYVTFTYDGKWAKQYVNGQLKYSRIVTSPNHPNSDDLFIGRLQDGTFPYFINGVIDEVRIYNRALCPTAVMQLSALKE